MTIEQIAVVCHEANKAFCTVIGDNSQKSWAESEQWQRDSAIKGVEFAVMHPDAPASQQHDAWLADKAVNGWKYGPAKNATLKEHPCIVPYEKLPLNQQLKDHLFKAIVKSLTHI